MGMPAIKPASASAPCPKCNKQIILGDRFCNHCGVSITGGILAPVSTTNTSQEFERNLHVAWSCVKDVDGKVGEIRAAHDAGDREIDQGTFRSSLKAAALQGRLESEFSESLDLAWQSADNAFRLQGNETVEIEGVEVSASLVKGMVFELRGELQFALDKLDNAISLYKAASEFVPNSPNLWYNLGAAYTNKHDPLNAVTAFTKAIELDPTGPSGVDAAKQVAKLKAGRLGKKAFSGSIKVLAVLGGFALVSLLMITNLPGPAFMGFVFWGGLATLYWRLKFR